jgi:hypothetical protein
MPEQTYERLQTVETDMNLLKESLGDAIGLYAVYKQKRTEELKVGMLLRTDDKI